jgi:hypothetical protein
LEPLGDGLKQKGAMGARQGGPDVYHEHGEAEHSDDEAG